MQCYSSARQPELRHSCIHGDNFQGKIPNEVLLNALLDEQWVLSETPFVKVIQRGVEEYLKFVDWQTKPGAWFWKQSLLNSFILWTRTLLFFYTLFKKIVGQLCHFEVKKSYATDVLKNDMD